MRRVPAYIKRLSGALVLLLLSVSFAGASDDTSLSRIVQKARAQLEGGNLPEALRTMRPALGRRPVGREEQFELAELYFLWAQAQLNRGDPEAARHAAARSRSLDARAQGSRVSLEAAAALSMRDPEAAVQLLESLARAETLDDEGMEQLAAGYLEQGKTSEAEKLLERLSRRAPGPGIFYQLGVLRFERGDDEAAMATFAKCLKLRPGDYYALIYSARASIRSGRLDDVHPLLRAAAGIASTPEIRYLEGRARLLSGDAAGAATSFRAALTLDANDAEALFGLGQALRKSGASDEARTILVEYRRVYGENWRRMQKVSNLEEECRRSPKEVRHVLTVARFLLETGSHDEAERYAWRALRLRGDDQNSRLVLARSLAGQRRFREAVVQYQKLIELQPASESIRRELDELIKKHAKRRP